MNDYKDILEGRFSVFRFCLFYHTPRDLISTRLFFTLLCFGRKSATHTS